MCDDIGVNTGSLLTFEDILKSNNKQLFNELKLPTD